MEKGSDPRMCQKRIPDITGGRFPPLKIGRAVNRPSKIISPHVDNLPNKSPERVLELFHIYTQLQ
jgi:hypothetical protein